MTREEMKKRFHKDIVKHILLILFTFGIYEIIWIARVTEFMNLKAPADKQKSVVGTVLLCLFIPFYLIYWMYKVDEVLIQIDPRPHNENLRVILLITSIVFSWVNVIYIQNVINIDVDQDDTFEGFTTINAPKVEIDPNASNESLFKRAQMFIEDKEWHKASAYCEALLDREPENAEVYLMLLLVKAQASNVDELKNGTVSFANFKEFEKVKKFCDAELVDDLIKANDEIIKRNTDNEIENNYNKAVELLNTGKISNLKKANKLLEGIKDYKNSSELIESNNQKIKKNTLTIIIAVVAIIVVIISGSGIKKATRKAEIHRQTYEQAVQYLEDNEYSDAIETFESLGKYKDAKEQIENVKEEAYNDALELMNNGNLSNAKDVFEEFVDYKDSKDQLVEINYLYALENFYRENYDTCIEEFTSLGDYKDSKEKLAIAQKKQEQKEFAKKLKNLDYYDKLDIESAYSTYSLVKPEEFKKFVKGKTLYDCYYSLTTYSFKNGGKATYKSSRYNKYDYVYDANKSVFILNPKGVEKDRMYFYKYKVRKMDEGVYLLFYKSKSKTNKSYNNLDLVLVDPDSEIGQMLIK